VLNQLPRVLLAWAALPGVPLWVGWAARVRREQAAAERRRVADDERLRVARELHDVVSHSIAMINAVAGSDPAADRRPGRPRSGQRRDRRPPGRQPGDRPDPRQRAMTKLHARDRAQLVVFAYQSGLVGQTRSRPT
jgi:hypothetical protein